MSRLNRILLATVLLLCSILWLQHRRTIRLTEERDRFRMNSTALLSDVKRMQIDSATMVLDAKALRLTIDEYKEFRAKDAETIERLGVKIRNLEVAARHEVEVKAPIDAAIRDTLIIRDTVPLLRQKVEMVTPYIQLTGLIENKRLKGDIKVPVTMLSYYVLSPVGDAKTVGGSYQRMFPTMKLYRSYDNADVRRDYNITGAYNPNNRYGSDLNKIPSEKVDGYKYYVPAESSGIASGTSLALWCTGKFRVSDPKERSSINTNQCVMNYPLMRMAEVRLQYAEALYFTGDESGARKQFDPVRERVLAGDVSLKKLNEAYYRSDFVEELLEERGRELCYESKRKIDLIRFGRITETIEELPSEGGPNNVAIGIDMLKDNWRNYKIWLPVPQLEIDLNPNLEQNAVYAD